MIMVLINILIICVVGAIAFWLIENMLAIGGSRTC